jgi:hypothetical protein
MLKRKPGILLMVISLIITTVPAILGEQDTQTIIIAGDGSGDYNCDGSSDQVEINQALEYAAANPEQLFT